MSDETTMTTEHLAECLDRWGSDLDRWPQANRERARALLSASEEARRLHAKALNLDRRFAAATPHRAPPQLHQRILDGLPEHELPQRVLDWFTDTLWRPCVAAACAMLIGFTVGVVLPSADDEYIADDLSMLAFSTTYAEIDDDSQ